jgi:hypothetical protein
MQTSAIVSGNYRFDILPDIQVQVGDVLRIIATDNFESVGVVDKTVTALTNIVQNIEITRHYLNLVQFPFYVSAVNTGAMAMKMTLDWCMWDANAHPDGPTSIYSEQTLFNLYKGTDAFINEDEMYNGLNAQIDDQHQTPPWKYGYFFNPSPWNTVAESLKSICVWTDYPINYYNDIRDPDVPLAGHPNHVPVAVPLGGNYNHWIVIRGIHTNRTAWPPRNVNVFGFWINDPATGGLGNNWYVTSTYFTTTMNYRTMTTGPYTGKATSIIEPPQGVVLPDLSGVTVSQVAPVGFTAAQMKTIKTSGEIGKTLIGQKAISELNNVDPVNYIGAKVTGVTLKGSEYIVSITANGLHPVVYLDQSAALKKIYLG